MMVAKRPMWLIGDRFMCAICVVQIDSIVLK